MQTPKQFLNLTLNAKDSPFGPPKAQTDQDLDEKQKFKLKEAQKIIFFSFISKPQNSFKNYHSQKNNTFRSEKSKTTPKSRQNQMSE